MRRTQSTLASRKHKCDQMCAILQNLRGAPKEEVEKVHSSLVFFTVESDMGTSTNDAIISLAETMLKILVKV